MFQHRASRLSYTIASLFAFLFLLGAAPVFGQISGAYKGDGRYFVFDKDGTLVTCDLDGDGATSGSYEISNGLIYFYNDKGRFTGSYYFRKSEGAITLSTDTDSIRLRYHCDVDEFVSAVLIGSALQAIFDN